jgi:quinol monooxygenase YgiN
MKNTFASTVLILITTTLYSQIKGDTTMDANSETAIVRISIGYFQPKQADQVESMLNNEFKNMLVPAIKKLKGNLGYYVAIDKEKNAMTNVSFWRTKEDALQMATLKEMLAMKTTFESLGLRFIEITNHQVLWKLPD